MLAFASAFFGVAAAQMPYLVYPSILLSGAFTDAASAHAMFLTLGVGAIITVPALYLLYYLFIYGKRA